MRIVGIDPGTARIGYALVETGELRPRLLLADTIETSPRHQPAERLAEIEAALASRLARDAPAVVAVERVYFSRNAKSAMAVAEARGVILLTAQRHAPSIWECTPPEVKSAVAGYGRGDKSQMRRAVRALLPGAALPAGDDAVDAIAIALTAAATIGRNFKGR